MDYAVITFIALALSFSIRNTWVVDERIRVATEVLGFAYREFERGLPWRWRVAELGRYSGLQMTLMFWRPVSSFYRNARCLQPHEELT